MIDTLIGEQCTRKDLEGSSHGLINVQYPGIFLEGQRKNRENQSE
jgi:hypothetical protein